MKMRNSKERTAPWWRHLISLMALTIGALLLPATFGMAGEERADREAETYPSLKPSLSPPGGSPGSSPVPCAKVDHLDNIQGLDKFFYLGGYSAEGTAFLALDLQGTLWRWDLATSCLASKVQLAGLKEERYPVKFSPDGRRAAMIQGGVLKLWNLGDGRVLARWRVGKEARALAFQPGSTILASAGGPGQLHLWDTERLTRSRTFEFMPRQSVKAVAYSPSGHRVGISLRRPYREKPNGETEAEPGFPGTRCFDTASWKETLRLDASSDYLLLRDDERYVVHYHGYGGVFLYDVKARKWAKLPRPREPVHLKGRRFSPPILSRDGQWLVGGTGVMVIDSWVGGEVWIWRVDSQQLTSTFEQGGMPIALDFHPDRLELAMLSTEMYAGYTYARIVFKDLSPRLNTQTHHPVSVEATP